MPGGTWERVSEGKLRMFAKEFLLKKDYELQARIGEGTYATVYKARRLSDSEVVAVKIINVFKMSRKKIENALNEVRIICAIDHPNVVGYHEAFLDEQNKDLYIVMEYVGGGDLNDRIRLLKRSKSFLPEQMLWKYAIQIMQGLKALHDRRIIHRDIKPGNIFVSEDLLTLKIGDLNVSKIMRNRAMTATVIGTPYYLAPEIWKNAMYDFRCDVFSFGCVLYEVSALRVPFQGSSIAELFKKIEYAKVPNLPKQYSAGYFDFILLCLTRNMRQRPTVDKLLRTPAILRQKGLCRDVVFDDRHTSKQVLQHIRVNDLSKLKQILPSLKSMRSNSVKLLAGAHSSNPKLRSARDSQHFSCLQNSQLSDSTSVRSVYKSRLKHFPEHSKLVESQKEKTRKRPKAKSRRKKRNSLSRLNSSKRNSLEAKKNYVRFLKEQRKRKAIRAKLEEPGKWKGDIRQDTIEEEGELVGTLEMEREKPLLLLPHAEPPPVLATHTCRKKLTRPPDKKRASCRRPMAEDAIAPPYKDNVFASQLSVQTHETDKKEMNIKYGNMLEEATNKRTRERETVARTSIKSKKTLSRVVSRSASKKKKCVRRADVVGSKKRVKVKRISVEHKGLGRLCGQERPGPGGRAGVRRKTKHNYQSIQVKPRRAKKTLCSERKILKNKFEKKKSQKAIIEAGAMRKKKRTRNESTKRADQEKAHFKRFINKKKGTVRRAPKEQDAKQKTVQKKTQLQKQILDTNKIKLKPLKNLNEMGVFSSSKKIGAKDIRRKPVKTVQSEYHSSELSSLQSHQSRLRFEEARLGHSKKNPSKKSTVLPIANKFKKKCLKIPNRTVISAYSNQSHIRRKIDSVKQKMKSRLKTKMYLPVAKKKRPKLPKKVKSHIECPSELDRSGITKPSRTLTSIAPQSQLVQSDYSDLESPRELRSPSVREQSKRVRVGTTPNSNVNNFFRKNQSGPVDFLEDNPLIFDSKKILRHLKTKNKKPKPLRPNKKAKKAKAVKPVNRSKAEKRARKAKKESDKRAAKAKAKNFRTGVLKMKQKPDKFNSRKVVSSQRFL